jgi:hypothetical protein
MAVSREEADRGTGYCEGRDLVLVTSMTLALSTKYLLDKVNMMVQIQAFTFKMKCSDPSICFCKTSSLKEWNSTTYQLPQTLSCYGSSFLVLGKDATEEG